MPSATWPDARSRVLLKLLASSLIPALLAAQSVPPPILSRPAGWRTWWACWLLGWLTGVHYGNTRTGTNHEVYVSFLLGGTVVSKVFDVAAAIAAILVIRAVSSHGVGREAQQGQAWTN